MAEVKFKETPEQRLADWIKENGINELGRLMMVYESACVVADSFGTRGMDDLIADVRYARAVRRG